jgi:GNAT superfamily N-acetyltransferase
VTIRAAQIEDLSACLVMARKFFAVCGIKGVEFDFDTCAERFITAVGQKLCFVAESQGQLVGFVLGAACPSIFNKHILAGVELAWWVEPEFRNGILGIKLLKAIENSAKEQGIKSWSMICLEAQEPEKVESMYLRLGYEKTERTFVRAF